MKKMSEEKKTEGNKVTRRSMLKWSAGLAVAGAIGVGLGYGASELLRPAAPIPGMVTMTETLAKTETAVTTETLMEQEEVHVNCGHGGPLNVVVKNGRIVRVDPFETPNWESIPMWEISARGKTFKPNLNIRKNLMNTWHQGARRYVYAPNRLLYPMKRVGYQPGGKGDISNRGKGEFVRISWDEALDHIAGEMERLRTTYGLGSIYIGGSAHYQSRGALCDGIGDNRNRFLSLYAMKGPTPPPYPDAEHHLPHGTNWNHSWIGWASAPDNMIGYYWEKSQLWPATDLLEDVLKNSNMVVYWSMDNTVTGQMYGGYTNEETWRMITEAGIKTISIVPTLNEMTAYHSDKWLPVYPGSDIALALAITHVWFTEGTWNKEWVATHAVGIEQFQDYVLGTSDGVAKTPEWAEPKCGVKARDIRALAREWAKAPVFLFANIGGANRGWSGDDWARMMIVLQTMQGNIGRPGGNLGSVPGEPALDIRKPNVGRTGVSFIFERTPAWPIHFHPTYSVWADCICNGNDKPTKWIGGTTGAVKYWKEFTMEHIYPYPGVSEVKMLGFNAPGGFNVESGWFEDRARGFMSPKIDLAWTGAIFQNDIMCRYCDILLPICTNYERVDLASIGDLWFSYMDKAIEPLGESVSDSTLFLLLARKLGFGDKMYNGLSEEEMMKKLYEWSSGPAWMSWDDFKKQGASIVPFDPKKLTKEGTYTPEPAMKWYYEKPGDSITGPDTGLTTPTGKIEIYHQPFADAYGENGPISAIPKWHDPSEYLRGGALEKKYPLLGHVAHFKWRFHSEFSWVSWLREMYKIKGPDGYEYDPIWINPQTATERGINDGDILVVSSKWGEMLSGAYLTERIMPGLVKYRYGSESDPVDGRRHSLDRAGNVNNIMTSQPYLRNGKKHNEQLNSSHYMVQIRKATMADLIGRVQ
jgi:anaerobic selenocysteine-containing dehydrogenase